MLEDSTRFSSQQTRSRLRTQLRAASTQPTAMAVGGAGGKVVMCQALLQLVVFVHERGALWSKAGPVFFLFFYVFFLGSFFIQTL